MKRLATFMLISSVSCSALAGAWVETREAYNTASELHEVILRAGYHFDQGAGVMLSGDTAGVFTKRYSISTPVIPSVICRQLHYACTVQLLLTAPSTHRSL